MDQVHEFITDNNLNHVDNFIDALMSRLNIEQVEILSNELKCQLENSIEKNKLQLTFRHKELLKVHEIVYKT